MMGKGLSGELSCTWTGLVYILFSVSYYYIIISCDDVNVV